jgi:hypothetical protein
MVDRSTFSFPVIVAGKSLRATVLAEEGEGRDFLYRVRFEDGYEDVFFVDGDKVGGQLGTTSQPYADAIKYDVGHFIGLNADKFWYVFQDEFDGEIVNVWIFEEEEEDEDEVIRDSFNVFIKKKYRFHLLNMGDSWLLGNREENSLSETDQLLAEKIGELLMTLPEVPVTFSNMEPLIVKVQLSTDITADHRQVLVYDKSRKHQYQMVATPEILELMNGRLKAFFTAEMIGSRIAIGEEVEPQDW